MTILARTARQLQKYLKSGAVIGGHLCDQLLLPMALAGGGAMLVDSPSQHAWTRMAVIEAFLPIRFTVEPRRGLVLVSVKPYL